MKISANEEKLTGLWAKNGATIQQVWILKFAFGPEKFPCCASASGFFFYYHEHVTMRHEHMFFESCVKLTVFAF